MNDAVSSGIAASCNVFESSCQIFFTLIWLRFSTSILLSATAIILLIYALTGSSAGYALEYFRFYSARNLGVYAYVDVKSGLTFERRQAVASILPRSSNTDSTGQRIIPLLWFDNYDLFIQDTRGRLTQLTDLSDFARMGTGFRYVTQYATWSPDDQWIGFLRATTTQTDVYAMRPDGSELKRLAVDIDNNIPPNWVAVARRGLLERLVATRS